MTIPTSRPSLNAAVMRALARDPERRYPSAAAFLSDLQAVSEGEWIGQLPDAIAILDFDNLSENPTHAWIATGVAEALATDLRRVQGLDVVPRERVLKVRAAIGGASSESSAAAIGLRLGCRWVLAGAYQTVGEALRVTMRLVETATGTPALTEKIDGTISDLFQMQDRLAAATVSALNLNLRAERRRPRCGRASALTSPTFAAGALFLRLEKGSMDQARLFYEDAVRVEPGYALALCGLAGFHAMQYTFTTDAQTLHDGRRLRSTRHRRRSLERGGLELAWLRGRTARQLKRRLSRSFTSSEELDPSLFFPFYFVRLYGACDWQGRGERRLLAAGGRARTDVELSDVGARVPAHADGALRRSLLGVRAHGRC